MTPRAAATIDLRSDTVTKPSPAMRRAMAEAEVGDDVYGEDPTVNRLQDAVAELLGVEAALFVPSGSMANQIALKVHTRPGDSVVVGYGAHNFLYESGAAGALSSVQLDVVPGDGRFDAAAVRAVYKPDNHLFAPTRLVCVENTHNMGGGLVWAQDAVAEVLACARELGLGTHLDGARLWNAAVATGRSEAELAAGFDTVAVCLSKGLGAPVGSLLCGRRELVHHGHRIRKMLGGGMRQAGILAAGGLYALEHHRRRLSDDHDNARSLASALSELPGLSVDLAQVHSNIVMIDLDADAPFDGPAVVAAASERGVLMYAPGPRRIRLVTHLDVDRAGCARAVEILADVVAELGARGPRG
ncbi:low-specificity L-threonine aldolase [Haliangium sp.]|uniref:low-specificity L-threonine aldolase n=1 Tax=Haliangium sp. TaxID=2663208 RepID=UPI003D0F451F